MRLSKKSLVIFLLAVLVCQAAVFFIKILPVKGSYELATSGGNQIQNGGFESGSSYWSWSPNPPQIGIDTDPAHAHTGVKSVYFAGVTNYYISCQSLPAGGWNCSLFSQAGFWGRVTSGIGGSIRMRCWYSGQPGYPHEAEKGLVLNSSYTWIDCTSLLYIHRYENITAMQIELTSYSGPSIVLNVDDVYMGSTPIVSADLDNVDPSSQDWVFTEWRYYTFTVQFPKLMFAAGDPSFAYLGFMIQTSDGLCNFAAWSNGTDWNYAITQNNPASSNASRSLDAVRVKAGASSLNSTYYTISFPLWFTEKCLDTLNLADAVDVYVWINNTSGANSGWVLGATELFQIYNRGGGATETQILGSAGQILGGKQFSFYANAGGQVFSDMIFRNLQHIKMLPEIRGYAGEEQWTVSGGVDYSLDDGSYLRGWQFDIEVSAVAYTGWLASQDWINMTVMWSFNNTWVKTDSIYMFYHGPVEASGDLARYRFWIDLWFDNTNSSTFGGGRINAYEFPMEDNSAVYLRWLSSSWGVKDSVEKESMCLFPLIAPDGTQLSASRISMVKIWMALAADDPQGEGPHQYVTMDKFDVWDTTLGKIPLEGIQTPSFDETKMPVMQNSGFLGFLFSAISGLFKWISDNIIFGGLALWPTFVGFLDTIAGWLGAPHFFTNLFTWLGSGWSWFASSFMYAITIIADIFLMLATTMGYIVWTLGQAIVGFASTIGMLAGMIGGTVGGASNLWNQLGLAQWLSLGIIIYPIYLVFLWEHEGMDAVIAQLSMIWGILSWLAHFFITVMQSVITAFSSIVESIPVVE